MSNILSIALFITALLLVWANFRDVKKSHRDEG